MAKKLKGQALSIDPFDYWCIEMNYLDQLNQKEINFIVQFYNEFVAGWFLDKRHIKDSKGKVVKKVRVRHLHSNKKFLEFKVNEIKENPEEYARFLFDKEFWEKGKNKGKRVTEMRFMYQKIKQAAWRKKPKKEDCFALNYRGKAKDESKATKSLDEITLEKLSTDDNDLPEFQRDFLEAYAKGHGDVIEFLIEQMDYALEIDKLENGFFYIEPLTIWWSHLKLDFVDHEVRLLTFKKMFHGIVKEILARTIIKTDSYFIYNNINLVFENHFFSKQQVTSGTVHG